jgi:alpha-galactosidase/6-phospho-beta-glucosidase family protein
VIADLNDALFIDLSRATDQRRVYEAYLRKRDAGYMEIESGAAGPASAPAWSVSTGYDKIALHVIRAIHGNSNAILPLNVVNGSSIAGLHEDDVVEVPCVVNRDGARPRPVGTVPDAVRELIVRVKEYERLTIDAAASQSTEAAVRALAANPLVADAGLARRLAGALSLEGSAKV